MSNDRNHIIRRDRRDDWNDNRESHSMGDSRNSRQDKRAMIIYSLFEYMRTHNTSIKQQNEARYPEYEYSHTQNTSMAEKLIRAQSEQIRRITAEEYIKSKCIKNVRWQQALKGERIWRRGN